MVFNGAQRMIGYSRFSLLFCLFAGLAVGGCSSALVAQDESGGPPQAEPPPEEASGYLIRWVDGLVVARNQKTQVDEFSGANLDEVLPQALEGLSSLRPGLQRMSLEGTFTARGPFGIPSDTVLDLKNAFVARVDGAHCILFQNSDLTNGNTNIRIEGGTVNGNWQGQTLKSPYPGPGPNSQYTVFFSSVTDSQIVGTVFLDDPDATLHCENCQRVTVSEVTLRGSRKESVSFWGGAFNEVLNSSFSDSLGSGIATAGSSDVLISGNTVEGVGSKTFTPSSISVNGRRNHVVGNTIRNSLGSGFTIGHLAAGDPYNASDSIFYENDISNVGGPGFSLLNGTPSKNITIRNNRVDMAREGIALGPGTATDPVENILLEDNTISRSETYCIRVGGGSGLLLKDVKVRNNECVNNARRESTILRERSAIAVFGEPSILLPGVVVTGNRCYDDQATQTQWYGVYMKDTSGLSVTNNELSGNSKGPTYATGANPGASISGNQ